MSKFAKRSPRGTSHRIAYGISTGREAAGSAGASGAGSDRPGSSVSGEERAPVNPEFLVLVTIGHPLGSRTGGRGPGHDARRSKPHRQQHGTPQTKQRQTVPKIRSPPRP